MGYIKRFGLKYTGPILDFKWMNELLFSFFGEWCLFFWDGHPWQLFYPGEIIYFRLDLFMKQIQLKSKGLLWEPFKKRYHLPMRELRIFDEGESLKNQTIVLG